MKKEPNIILAALAVWAFATFCGLAADCEDLQAFITLKAVALASLAAIAKVAPWLSRNGFLPEGF